ncbi:PepSY-associated TM helix domain-containing protein [Aeoliella mucimassa]|uniref:PepSY-associated TM helix n=1 Tax=Aeoliella mucimassa TaxID=2527972 RepID=A0A518AWD7_9BACT|nr:PepSY-associated TM helix domain-containing protein [Aeoliella mucimassa]QDU59047.1 hypothetical protein Pan181_52880 [Aeoliella mucimassa]
MSTINPSDQPAPLVQPSPNPRPRRTLSAGKEFRRWLAKWSRWLHIYLSMFGLAAILFFSATGITLNHPDWFFEEHLVQLEGKLPVAWLHVDGNPPNDWDGYDLSHEVDKLEVAEHLRAEHRLTGRLSDFLVFDDECEVTFEGPGYASTARISRESGEYTLDVTSNDLVTVMNDLHKGRHTGEVWSWVIDISAIIGVLVSLTGFVLIFFLRLRLKSALLVALAGTLALYAVYWVARG